MTDLVGPSQFLNDRDSENETSPAFEIDQDAPAPGASGGPERACGDLVGPFALFGAAFEEETSIVSDFRTAPLKRFLCRLPVLISNS
jgi:hypothetical protein